MSSKKILKIVAGVIIFITLPSLLLFGYLHFKYDEDLPVGTQNEQADALAKKMLTALDYEAYKNTKYIEWTYKKRRHYKWKKSEHSCTVYWEEYKVDLKLNELNSSKAYVHNFKVEGEQAKNLIAEAHTYFSEDSFWLVAPYRVFDEGVTRSVVNVNGKQELLVNYQPDDTYLWQLDTNGMPTSFKMWNNKLPFDGVELSWKDWTTTESGAKLPTFHKFMFFGMELQDVKGTK
ncbi:hypothetical protein [Meridianimaribacter flavus]|uniref:Uncharacterized protein n=1 Tax=Meridianimaribacter flavus TaxID=571115 RepID=A0ABY2G4U1_9FLAO|nr:hypothetical protein [Meridianimaribacter flavus]TDY11426.1 hypothetical protein A8975_2063 [Meridianimaribacter flavus]